MTSFLSIATMRVYITRKPGLTVISPSFSVNIFDCSGIAVGLCLSHKIVDGISTSAFLKGWAASARGSSQHVYPKFQCRISLPAK
ncbi:hypothetical protein F0562_036154 [Nyssa sinensis]|uniref:O-acyltransferase WSD1 C-terminal domain-containing protein n=1 Tax=Nyssa sinensis TaxID=561372 RepID=A0A5J5AF51_9ASTE|nr:hypothetical protein F0562_036154 [Nyssa sinensis]